MKSVLIRSYSGPYSVRMREYTDQNNSECGRLLRSVTRANALRLNLLFVQFFETFI